jgi:hypothetical protein
VNGAPSSLVSPGLWGFVAFFVLAIALYLLMRNMNARMRRMSYRSEELQREAEADSSGRRGTAEPEPGERAATPSTDEAEQGGDADHRQEQTGETH